MPKSNLRRKPEVSRETVASCLCWDRLPVCRKVVCIRDVAKKPPADGGDCQCPPARSTDAPAQSYECREAELPPVDCRAVQPPACPY